MAATASPTVSSTVGLKNVVIAPLTEDTEANLTYGELQLMAGAIEASVTPENADPDVQYADDIEFDVLYPDPELAFKTKMADIPLTIQEMIFGNKIDDNGVLIRSATDKPPYFAVGFMSEKSNHKGEELPADSQFTIPEAMDVMIKWFCILFQNQFTPDEMLDGYPVDRLMHDIALALMAVQTQTTSILDEFPTKAAQTEKATTIQMEMAEV